jgi:hypothetical protein
VAHATDLESLYRTGICLLYLPRLNFDAAQFLCNALRISGYCRQLPRQLGIALGKLPNSNMAICGRYFGNRRLLQGLCGGNLAALVDDFLQQIGFAAQASERSHLEISLRPGEFESSAVARQFLLEARNLRRACIEPHLRRQLARISQQRRFARNRSGIHLRCDLVTGRSQLVDALPGHGGSFFERVQLTFTLGEAGFGAGDFGRSERQQAF